MSNSVDACLLRLMLSNVTVHTKIVNDSTFVNL